MKPMYWWIFFLGLSACGTDPPQTQAVPPKEVEMTSSEPTEENNKPAPTSPSPGSTDLSQAQLGWVLRDKDGDIVRVSGLFPSRAPTPDDLGPWRISTPAQDCFQVSGDEQGPWRFGLSYELSTGQLCVNPSQLINESSLASYFIYPDENCEYEPYIKNFPVLLQLKGEIKTIWGPAELQSASNVNLYQKSQGQCIEAVEPYLPNGTYLWKIRPLPQELTQRFVDGAPYTLNWE